MENQAIGVGINLDDNDLEDSFTNDLEDMSTSSKKPGQG
jgi:hypothetical protein